jgi:hypothetical protein
MHEGVAGWVRVTEATGCGSRKSYCDIVRSVDDARSVEGADEGAKESARKGRSEDVCSYERLNDL